MLEEVTEKLVTQRAIVETCKEHAQERFVEEQQEEKRLEEERNILEKQLRDLRTVRSDIERELSAYTAPQPIPGRSPPKDHGHAMVPASSAGRSAGNIVAYRQAASPSKPAPTQIAWAEKRSESVSDLLKEKGNRSSSTASSKSFERSHTMTLERQRHEQEQQRQKQREALVRSRTMIEGRPPLKQQPEQRRRTVSAVTVDTHSELQRREDATRLKLEILKAQLKDTTLGLTSAASKVTTVPVIPRQTIYRSKVPTKTSPGRGLHTLPADWSNPTIQAWDESKSTTPSLLSKNNEIKRARVAQIDMATPSFGKSAGTPVVSTIGRGARSPQQSRSPTEVRKSSKLIVAPTDPGTPVETRRQTKSPKLVDQEAKFTNAFEKQRDRVQRIRASIRAAKVIQSAWRNYLKYRKNPRK